MPYREWKLRIEDILESVSKINHYIEGMNFEKFCADEKTVDATVRNLTVIGEGQHGTFQMKCKSAIKGWQQK